MIFLVLFGCSEKKQYFCIVKQVSLRIACHNKAIKAEGCKTYGSTSVEPFFVPLIKTSCRVKVLRTAPTHVVFLTQDTLLVFPESMASTEPPLTIRHT